MWTFCQFKKQTDVIVSWLQIMQAKDTKGIKYPVDNKC